MSKKIDDVHSSALGISTFVTGLSWVCIPVSLIVGIALCLAQPNEGHPYADVGVVVIVGGIFQSLLLLTGSYYFRSRLLSDQQIKNLLSNDLFCPVCDTEASEEASFCKNCGIDFDRMVCSKCDRPFEEGDKFCSSCGANV